jgi:hypothetical protein
MFQRKLLVLKAKQRKGSIMKPVTFKGIVAEAKRRGYRNPKAVAGAAYWRVVKAKYKGR